MFEKELRPIEEIRRDSKFTEIFKLLDLLDEHEMEYEFYDRSYEYPKPAPLAEGLDPNDPKVIIASMFSNDFVMSNVEHYQIIIRKPNSMEPLVSIIELEGYNDTLEIMSDTIYVHDEMAALEPMEVEQYLSAEEILNTLVEYYKSLDE